MEIVASNAAGTSQAAGKTWHFCSESCKYQFDAEPEKFIRQGGASVEINGVVRGLSTKEATDGSHHSRTTPDGSAERVDLPITGMTCAACANRIERRSEEH